MTWKLNFKHQQIFFLDERCVEITVGLVTKVSAEVPRGHRGSLQLVPRQTF